MASRNGIIPSSIPFEQRCPPPRPRKREPMTKSDRFVLAICGCVLGWFLWTISYLLLASAAMQASMKAASRQPDNVAVNAPANPAPVDPIDRLPPYWWGIVPSIAFAGFGTLFGAERMLDGFEVVLKGQAEVARAINRS